MLLFKKEFLDAIRAGRKTQTIRLWPVCRLRAGQRSYIPGVGYIRITAVDAIQLDDLTEPDAALDGFASLAELRAELDSLYAAQLRDGSKLYRVRFQVLPPEEQHKARA
jgi:hypothetical protein